MTVTPERHTLQHVPLKKIFYSMMVFLHIIYHKIRWILYKCVLKMNQ